jgi:hypothetical protein
MGSAFYLWLVEVEDALVRMIQGVFRFITEGLWEWIYHFVVDTVGPVTVRLARVTGLGCLWLFIVFGPVVVGVSFGLRWWWGFGCVAWLALSITGSIWGLRRIVRKRKAELVCLGNGDDS